MHVWCYAEMMSWKLLHVQYEHLNTIYYKSDAHLWKKTLLWWLSISLNLCQMATMAICISSGKLHPHWICDVWCVTKIYMNSRKHKINEQNSQKPNTHFPNGVHRTTKWKIKYFTMSQTLFFISKSNSFRTIESIHNRTFQWAILWFSLIILRDTRVL